MTTDIDEALTVLITQIFLGMYMFLLIDFKQPELKWKLRWSLLIAVVVAANIFVIMRWGYWEVYIKVAVFTMTLPYVWLTLWASRHKFISTMFSIATGLFIGCVGGVNAAVAEVLFPQFEFAKLLTKVISLALLYLLLRKFRQPYLRMLYMLKSGWLILCIIPISSFFTLAYITNTILKRLTIPAIIVMYSFMLICACAYALIYLFFEKVQQEYEAQNNSDLLSTQLYALTGRIDAVQSVEDKLRIERHDLRHRLQTVATLVEKGDRRVALEYIDESQKYLNNFQFTHWCNNPIIDATLSSYFQQIEAEGIELKTHIVIADDLAINPSELSIVFANALENAMRACRKLPSDKRLIVCRCISKPQLMLEISNSYAGKVVMDAAGLPVALEPEHGIGTRSIAAFVKKYSAFCYYEVKDGWFSLRISL